MGARRAEISLRGVHGKTLIMGVSGEIEGSSTGDRTAIRSSMDRRRWRGKSPTPASGQHLAGETAFSRWDTVTYRYRPPVHDKRPESCAVEEDSIRIVGEMPKRERAKLLNPLIVPSVAEAVRRGQSLALVRPLEPRFFHRAKSATQIAQERAAYARAARQGSLLDEALEGMEPSPYVFKFALRDADHLHTYTNGDWEAHAMFNRGRKRGSSDAEVLDWMNETFNVEYPRLGMAFAVGNQAKRPQVWQLLGVLRLDELTEQQAAQGSFL